MIRTYMMYFRMYRIGTLRPVSRLVRQSERSVTQISAAYQERLWAQENAHGVYSETARDKLWKDLTDPTVSLPDQSQLTELLNGYRRSFSTGDIPVSDIMRDFEELSPQSSGFMFKKLFSTLRF